VLARQPSSNHSESGRGRNPVYTTFMGQLHGKLGERAKLSSRGPAPGGNCNFTAGVIKRLWKPWHLAQFPWRRTPTSAFMLFDKVVRAPAAGAGARGRRTSVSPQSPRRSLRYLKPPWEARHPATAAIPGMRRLKGAGCGAGAPPPARRAGPLEMRREAGLRGGGATRSDDGAKRKTYEGHNHPRNSPGAHRRGGKEGRFCPCAAPPHRGAGPGGPCTRAFARQLERFSLATNCSRSRAFGGARPGGRRSSRPLRTRLGVCRRIRPGTGQGGCPAAQGTGSGLRRLIGHGRSARSCGLVGGGRVLEFAAARPEHGVQSSWTVPTRHARRSAAAALAEYGRRSYRRQPVYDSPPSFFILFIFSVPDPSLVVSPPVSCLPFPRCADLDSLVSSLQLFLNGGRGRTPHPARWAGGGQGKVPSWGQVARLRGIGGARRDSPLRRHFDAASSGE